MSKSALQVLILAAGKGTRMRSKKTKILHTVAGRPMIDHVIGSAITAGAERVIPILGHQKEDIQQHLKNSFPEIDTFAEQNEQNGTGHAIYCAIDYLGEDAPEYTLILSGDVPNLSSDTLKAFIDHGQSFDLTFMTAVLDDAAAYGRVATDPLRIVEFKDADASIRAIREINAGIYFVKTSVLKTEIEALCSSPPTNAQNEWYLTDIVAAVDSCDRWILPNDRSHEMAGVNNRVDLAAAEQHARHATNTKHMLNGVTLNDPATTYIESSVVIEADVTVAPNVSLIGKTTIATGTVIGPGAVIENTTIGCDVTIKPYCHFESASIENNAVLGPFVHLRPDASVGDGCKVGNFVEIKKSRLEAGAKANHHSYIGDAVIGAGANIGAGTIFCNYDGKNKHVTTIGSGAFVGSNSALVAPVTIGNNAYVGAGSVITSDVPDGALGVARGRQKVIENWKRRKG